MTTYNINKNESSDRMEQPPLALPVSSLFDPLRRFLEINKILATFSIYVSHIGDNQTKFPTIPQSLIARSCWEAGAGHKGILVIW